jgi:amidophosphoribosyltransferase
MSTVEELFAPAFLPDRCLTVQAQTRMAEVLGADSLRYLPVESIARAIDLPESSLCRACVTAEYPTSWGQELYEISLGRARNGQSGPRTYELDEVVRS